MSIEKQCTSSQPPTIDLGNLGQQTIVALSLQIAGVLLTYLMQICLARWMGQAEYGLYTYTMAWCITLSIPTGLGLPRTVLRFVSEYRIQEEWGQMRGVLFSSWQLTLATGLLVATVGTIGSLVINHYYHPDYAPVVAIGVWLIPLLALQQLQEDMGRGTKSLILAYGPSKVLWPVSVLVGCFILFQLGDSSLTSLSAIDLVIATLFSAVSLQLAFIWWGYAPEIAAVASIYARRQWLQVALPLLFHRAFREILRQIDVVMVGTLIGTEIAGIYNAAASTSLWVSFMLTTVNLVVAPTFTSLYTQKDFLGLQKVVSASSLWILWPSSIFAFCLIFLAKPILALFGHEFIAAHWSLKILVLGQLTNALCGSVGNLMVMTGYQNKILLVSSTCALTNLILDAIFIPFWGMNGAAFATAVTLITYNIWCSVLALRNTGIYSSAAIEFLGRSIFENRNGENI